MNKTTVALTQEQYIEIINTLRSGFAGQKPAIHTANALIIEANLGIRVSDIVKLELSDIVKDGNRHRLNITEQKTSKSRIFTVPAPLYDFLCSIDTGGKLVPITERQVQRQLKNVVDYLGYSDTIGTHSFRKMFATKIYTENNYNVRLVQEILQHSSTAITQRYLSISSEDVETALAGAVNLI